MFKQVLNHVLQGQREISQWTLPNDPAEHVRVERVCGSFNAPVKVTYISLPLFCSEWLDTWDSATLMSAERRELFGEKIRRPPFCLLASKSWLKSSPSVSSVAQNFKTKMLEEKKSIPLKGIWNLEHDHWIYNGDLWPNLPFWNLIIFLQKTGVLSVWRLDRTHFRTRV